MSRPEILCGGAWRQALEVVAVGGAVRGTRPGGGQAWVMALGGRRRQRLTLAMACMAQVMMVLDVLIVIVALPAMQHELRLSPSGLEWVVSGYALALAALIPFGGAIGDHFGRKHVFVAGVVVFTLASVGCALSVSGGMLIGFRVIQGIGGAVMSSLTLSLISEAYPPEERSGPIGLWAAVSGLAVAGGSVLGGLLQSGVGTGRRAGNQMGAMSTKRL